MDIVKEMYRKLLNTFGAIGGLLIAGIAVGVTVDVLLRNFGVSSFSWVIEVAEYALYISAFFAAPWVLSNAGHVKVDLLIDGVPRPVARVLEIIAGLIGLVVCAVLFWSGCTVTTEAARLGSMITKELVVVEWYLLLFIPASFFLMIIEFCLRIARAVLGSDGLESR